MISVRQIMAAIAQHQGALPAGATPRWAFLVTMDEIAALVDEIQTDTSIDLKLEPLHAQHIREGRAMLHINGTAVIPELIEADNAPQSLNG